MGFRTLHEQLKGECSGHGERGRTLLRALDDPMLMAPVESCYKALNKPTRTYLKSFVVKRLRSVLTQDVQNGSVSSLVAHVVDKLRLHVHAADVEVKRYARTCAALHADEPLRVLVLQMCDADETLATVVRASLDWTVADCIRRGCPVMPFADAQ